MSPGSTELCSTYATSCGETCAAERNDAEWMKLHADTAPDFAMRRLLAHRGRARDLLEYGDCAGICCSGMFCSDHNNDGKYYCSYDSSYEDLDTAADEFPPPDVDALEAMGYEALEGVGYLPEDDPQSVGRRLNGVVNVKVRCLS